MRAAIRSTKPHESVCVSSWIAFLLSPSIRLAVFVVLTLNLSALLNLSLLSAAAGFFKQRLVIDCIQL
ncbi:MAG: hypothetical protein QOI77_3696 [Blastocatellia bacterium]|nr:hypothetical protein [Blastocatellia bacterium]